MIAGSIRIGVDSPLTRKTCMSGAESLGIDESEGQALLF